MLIERSCSDKARVVAADEREAGSRALLNLGHTFGHAMKPAPVTVPGCMARRSRPACAWPLIYRAGSAGLRRTNTRAL